MAGRPKIYDEKTVISKALDVFWKKGYEAASADDLMEAMGIGKGSFYLAFKGGKKELYERSLEQFAETFYKNFLYALFQSDDQILFISNFFIELIDEEESKQAQGCYLGNALIQMSSTDPYMRSVAQKLLIRMERIFTDVIRKAQEENRIQKSSSPEVMGKYLINLWNGINVTRRMYPNDNSLKNVVLLNLQMLN